MTVERRRLHPLGVLLTTAFATAVLAGTTSATAAWPGGGSGEARTAAGVVAAPAAPAAGLVGVDVVVSWPAITGAPTPAYVVRRYDDANQEVAVGENCDVHTVFLTCTETAVPAGTWRYTVTAEVGTWTGEESPPSEPVVVP